MLTNTNVNLGTAIQLVAFLEHKQEEGQTLSQVVNELKGGVIVPNIVGFTEKIVEAPKPHNGNGNGNGNGTHVLPRQIAKITGRKVCTVYGWVKKGNLRFRKIKGTRMIEIAEANKYLSKRGLPLITPDVHN